MLKTSESSSRPRELARGKDSVREKLRAKIRQRIHNPQFEEGDENVNTLNREKAPRTQQERRKTAPVQNDKVGVLCVRFRLYMHVLFFSRPYLNCAQPVHVYVEKNSPLELMIFSQHICNLFPRITPVSFRHLCAFFVFNAI